MKINNTEGVERLRIGNEGTIWKDENGNVTMIHQEPVIKVTNFEGGQMGTTPLTRKLEVISNAMKTLENIKPGDWVKMQVSEIAERNTFPIKISSGNGVGPISFTKDGLYHLGGEQIIFPLEEDEQPKFKERWMMVSDNEISWEKRKVFTCKKGYHIAWSSAKTDKEVQKSMYVKPWRYAKEIEEEQPKELSLEERVKILEEKLSKTL
jgi:hypothetical protein